MNVYFAGAIAAGRQDARYYEHLIKLISKEHTVISSVIGDDSLNDTGEDLPAKMIYEQDMQLLKEADAIVAEITHPSMGVGYQIAKAEDLDKPVLCLFRPGSDHPPVSSMIVGSPKTEHQPYQSSHDAYEKLKAFLAKSAGV